MTKKSDERPQPEYPAHLEKNFQAIVEACDEIAAEVERMSHAKRRYERSVV